MQYQTATYQKGYQQGYQNGLAEWIGDNKIRIKNATLSNPTRIAKKQHCATSTNAIGNKKKRKKRKKSITKIHNKTQMFTPSINKYSILQIIPRSPHRRSKETTKGQVFA